MTNNQSGIMQSENLIELCNDNKSNDDNSNDIRNTTYVRSAEKYINIRIIDDFILNGKQDRYLYVANVNTLDMVLSVFLGKVFFIIYQHCNRTIIFIHKYELLTCTLESIIDEYGKINKSTCIHVNYLNPRRWRRPISPYMDHILSSNIYTNYMGYYVVSDYYNLYLMSPTHKLLDKVEKNSEFNDVFLNWHMDILIYVKSGDEEAKGEVSYYKIINDKLIQVFIELKYRDLERDCDNSGLYKIKNEDFYNVYTRSDRQIAKLALNTRLFWNSKYLLAIRDLDGKKQIVKYT